MARLLEGSDGPAGSADPFPRSGNASHGKRILRHHVDSFETFERLNVQANVPLDFRATSRQAPELDIRGIVSARLAIWMVGTASGFESIPAVGLDVYSVRFVVHGALTRCTSGMEYEMQSGEATILPAADVVGSRFQPGTEVLACTIAASELLARHEMLEGHGAPLRLHTLARIEGLHLRALVDTIRRIVQHIGTEADTLAGPLLLDILLNQILSVWPQERPVPNGGDRTVSRAIDYIDAHLGEALTVGEVAAAACVGVRTLQTAFRAQTGRTPLGYILDRRLERAHADLLANEGRLQVSQIAYRWGFLHMGEFARRYRLRYGCSPSQTGRRPS